MMLVRALKPKTLAAWTVVLLCYRTWVGYYHSSSSSESFGGPQESNTNTSKQLQFSHGTLYDRYPPQFACTSRAVRSAMARMQDKNNNNYKATTTTTTFTKILSFGSSTGREAKTLADKYFNHTNEIIFGVDLDEQTLAEARAFTKDLPPGKVVFFHGATTPISAYAPYDAIFADAVLCYHNGRIRYTPTEYRDTIFPYTDFLHALSELDKVLKVGGILQLVNTNYDFRQTEMVKRYREISCDCTAQFFVPVVDIEKMEFIPTNVGNGIPCIWEKMEDS